MSKRRLHLWRRHVQTCTAYSDVKVSGSPYCDPICSRNDRHLGKVLKTGGCESSNTCWMSDCQICLKPIKACPTKDTSHSIVTHIHPHLPHVSHVENHITIIPQLSRHCNHCSGQPGVSGNELPSYFMIHSKNTLFMYRYIYSEPVNLCLYQSLYLIFNYLWSLWIIPFFTQP